MPLPSLSAILAWHRGRYPLFEAQDIYKLVHQGVFGPGHAVASTEQARNDLERELRTLATEVRRQHCQTGAVEAKSEGRRQNGHAVGLIEEIDPMGRSVRVNLRAFIIAAEVRSQHCQTGAVEANAERRRQMGRAEWLVEAMVESARRVKGDPTQMRRRLSVAVRWCRTNLPRQAAGLERMAVQAGESGFPAFHHSPAYKRAYRPAYRVILSACLRPRVSGRAS